MVRGSKKGGERCGKNDYSGRVIGLAVEQEVEMEEISQLGRKRPLEKKGSRDNKYFEQRIRAAKTIEPLKE
jgi:hypothetical protein